MPDTYFLILMCAAITYLSRSGGYLVMTYFGTVNHRVKAGLDAVPIAVLSALVAPSIVDGATADSVALILVCVLSLRLSLLPSVTIGVLALAMMRATFG